MAEGDEANTSWLRKFEGWPLIGRLWEVPADALVEARKEVLYATFFSTMPFWFPVIGMLIFKGRPAVWETLTDGGLFIYAAAIIGPLGYIITKRHGRFKLPDEVNGDGESIELSYRFPAMQETFYFSTVVCVLSGVILSVQRVVQGTPGSSIINEIGVVALSIIVAVFGTLLLFCVTAYRNMMESLEKQHSDLISSSLKDTADAQFEKWLDTKGSKK